MSNRNLIFFLMFIIIKGRYKKVSPCQESDLLPDFPMTVQAVLIVNRSSASKTGLCGRAALWLSHRNFYMWELAVWSSEDWSWDSGGLSQNVCFQVPTPFFKIFFIPVAWISKRFRLLCLLKLWMESLNSKKVWTSTVMMMMIVCLQLFNRKLV